MEIHSAPLFANIYLARGIDKRIKELGGKYGGRKVNIYILQNIYEQLDQYISRHHQRTSYRVNYLTRAPLNIFGTKSHANQPEISLSY